MNNSLINNSAPLLSVVVPVYNVERYLDECLEHIVGQSYRNLEIILVDDGSKDSSGKKCDEWQKKDSRIKVVHKQNQGLGEARNTGMENATGDYIVFIDSDDYVETDAYRLMIEKALEYDSDMLVGGFMREKSDGSKAVCLDFDKERIFDNDEDIKKLAVASVLPLKEFSSNRLSSSSCKVLYKRTLLSHRFVSERKVGSEDLLFNVEAILKSKKVVYIPYPFYFYRYNSGSLSHTLCFDLVERYELLTSKINEIFSQNGITHTADYMMLQIAIDVVRRMHFCKIFLKERYAFLKRLCREVAWNNLSINCGELTLSERTYLTALKRCPIWFTALTESYYLFKKL